MESHLSRLLEIRRKTKSRMPRFIRQDVNNLKNRKGWRKPKGGSSKMRYGLRGYHKCIQVGYGSPNAVKNLHRTGLKMVVVYNVADLAKLNPKTDGVVVAGKTGIRKKLEIIAEAKKKSLQVLNLKADDYVKQVHEDIKQKKEAKLEKLKKKEAKKKQKVEPKKEEQPAAATEEEKKEQEKAEKDKVLTKRG